MAGFADLSHAGVADRSRDLALCTRSIARKYGEHWSDPFLEAYGMAPNPRKVRFFRLLVQVPLKLATDEAGGRASPTSKLRCARRQPEHLEYVDADRPVLLMLFSPDQQDHSVGISS